MKPINLLKLATLFLYPSLVFSQTNKIESTGNVGIGTLTPRAALEVKGDLLLSPATLPMGLNAEIFGTTPLLNMDVNFRFNQKNANYIGAAFRIDTRTHVTRLFQWLRRSPNSAVEETLMILDEFGNLGIGTENPLEKLSVKGRIRATEIKVETDNWPDYVFTKNYRLPELTEVEDYIIKNNHLPGIPSAAQAEAEGIDLGEMNKNLLKKIEELTLYIISAKKREDSLSEDIELIKSTLKSNSEQIIQLTKKLEQANSNPKPI